MNRWDIFHRCEAGRQNEEEAQGGRTTNDVCGSITIYCAVRPCCAWWCGFMWRACSQRSTHVGGGGGGSSGGSGTMPVSLETRRPTSKKIQHQQDWRLRLSHLEVVAELAAPLAHAYDQNPGRHGVQSAPVSNLDLQAGRRANTRETLILPLSTELVPYHIIHRMVGWCWCYPCADTE